MNRILLRAVAALVSGFALLSCSEPSSYEEFQRVNELGLYDFTLNVQDRTAVYDLSFFTRIDGQERQAYFPIEVKFISPAGEVSKETVWFDASRKVMKYRTGLSTPETGEWKLVLKTETEGLSGMGIIFERKDGPR